MSRRASTRRQLDIANTTARSGASKKLLRALEYLSQFQVRLFHRKGADHVIPDALSRMPGPPQEPDVDDMFVYQILIMPITKVAARIALTLLEAACPETPIQGFDTIYEL